MKNDYTWISLHRKFLKWQWYKNINVKTLFIHLLLKANYKDNYWQDIVIKRGQILTSIKNLSDEIGLTEQQTRTALNKLKSTNEITIKTTSKFSLITIEKYDFYQNNNKKITNEITQNLTNEQQTNNKQITTNNNINNNNNIYIYFINIYIKQNLKNFSEKIKFLREIKNDSKYKDLSKEDENDLINYVLSNVERKEL